MSDPIRPMPPAPNAVVQVYLPRAAYERITTDDAKAAAKRLGYDGSLRWESSTHKIPDFAPAASVRVTCRVAEAVVLLDCFRALSEVASARHEDETLIACGNAFKALSDGIDKALAFHRRTIQ